MDGGQTRARRSASGKHKVVRTRMSGEEHAAVAAAANAAGMTVSAFLRSLALEGAGVRPFLSETDRAILQLLARDLVDIGKNLSHAVRALNAGGSDVGLHLAASVDDARAVAMTVAGELAQMTKRAGAARRGESS
ncbi:plasmid mobilization protein [Mesorhizobium sp. B1-1-8]|uniref:plasmid mobilization protein n=1 Tax=Mesorhizobium sp. B1-1-8 TaxID=2589976 RepID=UPI001D00CB8C|nr:plasmid mobilization relaxosome protein MobC [Mesorhizobium sp. B1-1-8]UCI10688.1 plasmid mobilization relaxosome protein MobC [Mesorhizobium sp. B1-1-8]